MKAAKITFESVAELKYLETSVTELYPRRKIKADKSLGMLPATHFRVVCLLVSQIRT
jgi:hypothetical protein